MNVSMMQPTFMPWQGLFELIYESDLFIFLDDFQFSVQSYHQRNRLFVGRNTVNWYTAVVEKKKSFGRPLNETTLNEEVRWRQKMWRRIEQNYRRAPCYCDVAPFLEEWLLSRYESLAEQNRVFIEGVSERFGWPRKWVSSSAYPSDEMRSKRVLELLRMCGADCYYCAHSSFEYMKEDGIFPVKDIDVRFQDYEPRPYTQILTDEFVPKLSVVDALMNVGFEGTAKLIVGGTQRWLTWDEMASAHLCN